MPNKILILFLLTSFMFSRGLTISGYLKDKNSSSIKGARVELRMGTYPKAVNTTSSDGRGIFSFEVSRNIRIGQLYSVKINYMGYDTLLSSKKYTGGKYLSFGTVLISPPQYLENAKQEKPELFLPKDEFESTAMYESRTIEREKFLSEFREREKAKKLSLKKKKEIEDRKKIDASKQWVDLSIDSVGKYNADLQSFSHIIFSCVSNQMNQEVFNEKTTVYARNYEGNIKIIDGRMLFTFSTDSWLYGQGIIQMQKVNRVSKNKTFQVNTAAPLKTAYTPLFAFRNQFLLKNVSIPLEDAKTFKENLDQAAANGIIKLNDDQTDFNLYNVSIEHPLKNKIYKVGDWKEDEDGLQTFKAPLLPPKLEMRLAFSETNNNGVLDAGEDGEIIVELTNNGEGPANNLILLFQEEEKNKYLRFNKSYFVGRLDKNQIEKIKVKISANKKVNSQINTLIVSSEELNGFHAEPQKIIFETSEFIPPQISMVDFGIETGDGDNMIKPEILTNLIVRIQNVGEGIAENISFDFIQPENLFLSPESKSQYNYSLLKSGEYKDLNFKFFVNKRVSEKIEIIIDYLEESVEGEIVLSLDIEKPQKTIEELVVISKNIKSEKILDVANISIDIEKDIPKTKRNSKHDLAVVFGIEFYKDVPGVSFAKRDAVWIEEYFLKTLNIPKNRMYVKTDDDVSQAEFRKVFSKGGWLDKRIKKNKSNIYFYFAGHGAPNLDDGKGYLIPYDGDPNYASQTGYALDELYQELNRIESKSITIFLDACFSGVNRNNEMLLANARPVFLEVDESFTDKVTVFSAAGSKQISSSWPEKKHGLFSYFLMKGMKGEADINSDKKLTYGELSEYIIENVSSTAGLLDREQTPSLSTQNEHAIFISY